MDDCKHVDHLGSPAMIFGLDGSLQCYNCDAQFVPASKLDRYRKAINYAGALALQKASHEHIRETLAGALSDE